MRLPGLRWGDWLVAGLAVTGVVAAFPLAYAPDTGPARLQVTQAGGPVVEYPLGADRWLQIPGPAGITEVEIREGRARCVRSPGAQGICERAGWLERDGDLAVSLPNRLVLQVRGNSAGWDSLHF
jgi:hypothetical protein